MALQIPSVREIVEILELHIHSLPVLIVLGVFKGMLSRGKTSKIHSDDAALGTSNHLSSSPTLLQIEDYYKNQANVQNNNDVTEDTALLSPARVRSTADNQTVDQWGYFADFEEHVQELPPSASLVSLSPLQEMEEEEE